MRTAAPACGHRHATTKLDTRCGPRMAPTTLESFQRSRPPARGQCNLSTSTPNPAFAVPGGAAWKRPSFPWFAYAPLWSPTLSSRLHGRFPLRWRCPFASPCFAADEGRRLSTGASSRMGPCALCSMPRSAGPSALLRPRDTAAATPAWHPLSYPAAPLCRWPPTAAAGAGG